MTTQYNQYIERLTDQVQKLQDHAANVNSERDLLLKKLQEAEDAFEELKNSKGQCCKIRQHL